MFIISEFSFEGICILPRKTLIGEALQLMKKIGPLPPISAGLPPSKLNVGTEYFQPYRAVILMETCAAKPKWCGRFFSMLFWGRA